MSIDLSENSTWKKLNKAIIKFQVNWFIISGLYLLGVIGLGIFSINSIDLSAEFTNLMSTIGLSGLGFTLEITSLYQTFQKRIEKNNLIIKPIKVILTRLQDIEDLDEITLEKISPILKKAWLALVKFQTKNYDDANELVEEILGLVSDL